MSLTEKNIKERLEEYCRTRDMALRNEIVEHYLYVVDILVKKYLNRGVDYEDLYQVGSMALIMAVERFDSSKGFEFSSFATPTIIGEIKRYFRDKGWAVKVPRRLKEVSAQIPKVRDEIERRTGKVPTVAEIAEVLGVSQELVLEAMESSHSYGTYSLNQTFDDSGEEGDSSVFEKYLGQREAGYDSFELSDMIRSVYNDLSEKEQEIFRLRFMENKTQQEIADLQGTSQMTVSRIEKKLKEKFKAAYIS
ncbi:MAG: SigB/SigF/SigG family RNA polymerase sigma factor [Firmicutes bacterium]|nr:SigB/SigF/SigG family RNA polymerase sigma factor [Bacillota bacterium]MBQ2270374.1 SigB/SigF/SigG family RNA polymerase sigma factor [Bacillota bacterium]MBQ5796938.1 SigB/SigF/SigG family RNA polymerase sigma factor [Bacillota bacterium]